MAYDVRVCCLSVLTPKYQRPGRRADPDGSCQMRGSILSHAHRALRREKRSSSLSRIMTWRSSRRCPAGAAVQRMQRSNRVRTYSSFYTLHSRSSLRFHGPSPDIYYRGKTARSPSGFSRPTSPVSPTDIEPFAAASLVFKVPTKL